MADNVRNSGAAEDTWPAVLMFLLVVLTSPLQAQQKFSNQKFRSYSTRAGLSNNSQSCIVQDQEGFLWIGTMDGLNRFDGHSFKVYRKLPHDSSSLQSNAILSLQLDNAGALWVGTSRGGLSRYNREQDNFTNYRSDFYDSITLASDIVTAIVQGPEQQLWVGTYEGLNLLNKNTNQFKRYTYTPTHPDNPAGLAFNQISTLTLDDHTLWIGYYCGTISAFDSNEKRFSHYKLFAAADRSINELIVTSICVRGNLLWISTWGKGIWIFNKQTHTCTPFAPSHYQFTNHIFSDNENNLWIATESDGLLLIDKEGKSITQYRHDDLDAYSLSTNCISKIFQDKQGNLWLGNKRGSLHYLIMKDPFRVWRKNPGSTIGLMNNNISCVLEDRKRRLWVGYVEGGIEILDAHGARKKITIPGNESTDLGEGTVNALYESYDGTIWVGTFLGGLKKYDEQTGTFISYKHNLDDKSSIACNNVRQITEDDNGNLWLALHGGGLSVFNPALETFKQYRVNYRDIRHTINSDWLLSVLLNQDDVWVGSVSGITVLHKKNNEVRQYRNNPGNDKSLSNENVNVIVKDSRGFVWIGTNDGLNKADANGNFLKVYTTRNGLPHNVITGILEDDHYNLWITTNHGLSKLSPGTDKVKNYFIEDGLETDEFTVSARFKNSLGEMYFGGHDGLIFFHPDSLQPNHFIPPVYITDFSLFNKPVAVRQRLLTGNFFSLPKQIRFMDNLTLAYDQNIVGFEFVALDYLNMHKIQYAYKLDGFDEDWINANTKREAHYTNLHPGTYTFLVKASNGDGAWGAVGKGITITITPPFWKTIWAYMLYALIFVLFLYGFWVLVFRHASMVKKLELEELEIIKLQKMDAQKMDFFSNISHEFRTPLTLIVGPLENLMKSIQDEFNLIQVKIIYRNAARLLRLINQLMDFSKLEADGLKLEVTQIDVVRFTKAVSHSFMSEARQRNITFTIHTIHDSLMGWFDRDKYEKILFNIIGNAFKFTPNHGQIRVFISEQDYKGEAAVHIRVEDSGLGIAEEAIPKIFDRFYQAETSLSNSGTGIGLALAKALAELHGGEINVVSKLGLGSSFSIIIPLQVTIWHAMDEPENNVNLSLMDIPLSDNDNERKDADNESAEEKPRLLIIDDNADMRLFIKYEFSDTYQVSEAGDGTRGFEKACHEFPDVIVCDVMMPGTSGITLCEKIKLNVLTSHIPVILLTARNSEEYILKGLQSGATDYIAKPFKASILKAKIRNLMVLRDEVIKRFLQQPHVAFQEISPTAVDEKFLRKAYEIVEKNLGNPDLDVDAFSMAIGISRTQLYRKIQALSGQSVKEFIRIIRLKKAAEMLVQAELNISQVAFEVGFSSVAYFTKSFSVYFGVTPSKYISLNKKDKSNAANFQE